MTVIDEYLATFSEPQRKAMEHVRQIAFELLPTATEHISYGIPVLKNNGKYLVGFAPYKNHQSIFPGSAPIEILKAELTDYKLFKGTIQFTHEKQIPDDLLKRIIILCLETSKQR